MLKLKSPAARMLTGDFPLHSSFCAPPADRMSSIASARALIYLV